jgi:uncharacterized protein DUF11/FG-GAP repeat protein
MEGMATTPLWAMLALGVLLALRWPRPAVGQVSFATTDFPTGTNPAVVVVADLNGDGKPDLVVPNAGANTVSVLLNIAPASADLGVAIAATPDPVGVGASLTYTVTVTTNGPNPAAGVTLVSATSGQGTCTGSGPVTCGIGTLASGVAATVTIVVTPTVSGILTNTVSVNGTMLPVFNWIDAAPVPGGSVQASHLSNLRTALNEIQAQTSAEPTITGNSGR